MSQLQNYQKSLIDNGLNSLRSIIDSDYSIGEMNHSLSDLKNDLVILPRYKKYVANQIHKMISFYRHSDKVFYQKYHKMNAKYIEIVLNLSNFKF